MGLQARISNLQLNGLLDVPKQMMYVYQVTYEPSGHFYIGKTSRHLDHRIYEHIGKIINRMTGQDNSRCPPFYDIIISELAKDPNLKIYKKGPACLNKNNIERHLRETIIVSVLAIVSDVESLDLLERFQISRHTGNSLLTNIQSCR